MTDRLSSAIPWLRPTQPDEPATVLVVEDDPSSRELLAQLLRDEGYRVHTAAGAWEAIRGFDRRPPDLVISDICMSEGDGISLLRTLREGPYGRIPVIVVSAHNATDRRVTALDLGADDFVSKPIEVEELLARLRSHLRRSQRESLLATSSYIDELTSLPNRRALSEFFEQERRDAGHEHEAIALVMMDLNGFKALNDQHGHVAGDVALREVARFLLANVRVTDCVGRLGGDEFLVVVPESRQGDACDLANRLRSLLPRQIELPAGLALEVDMAIGVTTVGPGEGIDAALPRADAQMYANKRRSRKER